jgi:hypothetical protein
MYASNNDNKIVGTQAHRHQDDLINLIIKIMGDTQTDGQTQTRIHTQTVRCSQKPTFIFQNK